MTDRQPVELVVLCGFLGSGKTTLLADFLRQAQMADTAVIVNEAGEIGIDGVLVAEEQDALDLRMLANGCVCCSLRSSLVTTVADLLDAPRPAGALALRRVILETSGLSRPGPILASLADPELSKRGLRVSVVSTLDAQLGGLRTEQFEDAAAQLAAAQKIILTKIDLVDDATLGERVRQAQAFNPLAEVVSGRDRATLVDRAFASTGETAISIADVAAASLSFAREGGIQHNRIHVLRGEATPDISWESLSWWLDDLAGLAGEKLLRVKALVNVTDCEEPILIQGVGTTYGMPRRMSTQINRPDVIIVITRDLSADEISKHFEQAAVKLYPMSGVVPSVQGHSSQISLSSPRSFYASNDL
jgi:G3E family GTPase